MKSPILPKRVLRAIHICCLGLLFLPSACTAQTWIGAKAGALFSRPTIRETRPRGALTIETVNSLLAGAVMQVPLTERVALLVEPGIARKGLRMTLHVFAPGLVWSADADYFELPVSLKLDVLSGPAKPYVTAGSSVAYKISETIHGSGLKSWSDPFYARYDVTLLLGGGLSYSPAGSALLFAEGRYAFGLNNKDQAGTANLRSAEWRIAAGIMFSL